MAAWDENRCGLLEQSLYGTRDAAKNWEEAVRHFMQEECFVPGKSNPCFYWHEGGVRGEIHGDDFVMGGKRKAADRFKEALCARFEVTHNARLGPKPTDDNSVRILNRVISWTPQGIEMEADQRHAELIVDALGIETAKGLDTTGEKTKWVEADFEHDDREEMTASRYRSIAARANFLAQDRSDIRFAVAEVSRGMQDPRRIHWRKIKHLGR